MILVLTYLGARIIIEARVRIVTREVSISRLGMWGGRGLLGPLIAERFLLRQVNGIFAVNDGAVP